jgi:hypothetical protein
MGNGGKNKTAKLEDTVLSKGGHLKCGKLM